jgi:hypothetical protein
MESSKPSRREEFKLHSALAQMLTGFKLDLQVGCQSRIRQQQTAVPTDNQAGFLGTAEVWYGGCCLFQCGESNR